MAIRPRVDEPLYSTHTVMRPERRHTGTRSRRRSSLAIASLMAMATSVLTSCETLGPGSWSPLESWPIIAIHAAVTPDGKVMTYGTGTDGVLGGAISVYDIWDPATGSHSTLSNPTSVDLFCSTLAPVPGTDDVMTAGGDNGNSQFSEATAATTLYSAALGLRSAPPMHRARWYGTGNTLPNGDILVEGGSAFDISGPAELTPEIYTPGVGWRLLTGATSSYAYGDDQSRWWYPRSWVAPDGRVFGISGSNMYYLDTAGAGSVTSAGTFPGDNTQPSSTAVMYRPGKILQVGGTTGDFLDQNIPASRAATIVDINGGSPVLSAAQPMHRRRHWATATVLPNGRVLVTGGSELQNSLLGDVGYSPEVWDPDTDTWRELSAEVHPRLYHSVALLLPDGRVLVAGGGAPGPVQNLNAQIFSPTYLEGDRPTISSAPSSIDHGANFTINVSSDVSRITLVRAGSVTHSFNSGQRFMELAMSGHGSTRTVTAPANANVAPPGTYMLFALNSSGAPSVAKMVQIDG